MYIPELPNKLKALMQSAARVYTALAGNTTAGRPAVFRLEICNARLCDRLFELGLTPRKSLTMEFPRCHAGAYAISYEDAGTMMAQCYELLMVGA